MMLSPSPDSHVTHDAHRTLMQRLEARFVAHRSRHPDVKWVEVHAALTRQPSRLDVLQHMESSGGEPDIVSLHDGELTYCDCSEESPAGRRSLCYDGPARATRKAAAPASSAMEMAAGMGVELMTEAQYHALQQHGAFDCKSSSWLATPAPVRELGGAIFGDRRYDRVFIYHNGAQSYYAVRGFRGVLRL